jgi:hypothetical protein
VLHALFVGTVQVPADCSFRFQLLPLARPAGNGRVPDAAPSKAERRDHLAVAISFAAGMNTPLGFHNFRTNDTTTGTN